MSKLMAERQEFYRSALERESKCGTADFRLTAAAYSVHPHPGVGFGAALLTHGWQKRAERKGILDKLGFLKIIC